MKVIVTDATGFIGRNIAESFHNDGIEVLATGRYVEVGNELQNIGIEYKRVDVLKLSQLKKVFSPSDCVIHLTGLGGPRDRYRYFFNANVSGDIISNMALVGFVLE